MESKVSKVSDRRMSLIPVRCFTCKQVVGNKWEPYVEKLKSGVAKNDALDQVGLARPCCRRMVLCHIETFDKLLAFQAMETENMRACMQATAGGGDDGEDSGGDD